MNLSLSYYQLLFCALCFCAFLSGSGTPFLDLHSAFLSLFALYFLLIYLKKETIFIYFFQWCYWDLVFEQQVPASYFALFVSMYLIMISYKNKNFKIIVVSISSLVLFLSVLYFYLEISNTGVKEFIFQYLVFMK